MPSLFNLQVCEIDEDRPKNLMNSLFDLSFGGGVGSGSLQNLPSHLSKSRSTIGIARMKKLNIFNAKKNSSSGKHGDGSAQQSLSSGIPGGDTINRLVNQKELEKRKWEKEMEEHDRKRREHEIQLVELERLEVARREEEVRKKIDDMDEKRRNNRLIQEKVAEQLKILTVKLEEYKIEHKKAEEELEDEIARMEDHLMGVKNCLEKRVEALESELQQCNNTDQHVASSEATNIPAPSAPSFQLEAVNYPTLVAGTQRRPDDDANAFNASKIMHLNGCGNATSSNGVQKSQHRPPPVYPRSQLSIGNGSLSLGSVGSSPMSDHSGSSRSVTPKTDASDGDTSV